MTVPRWIRLLLLGVALASCSSRNVVVDPEVVSNFNDSQWTIESEPLPPPR